MKITLFITLNVSNGLEEKICRVIVILNSRHLLLYKYLSVSLHQITNDGDCMCYGTLPCGGENSPLCYLVKLFIFENQPDFTYFYKFQHF